MVWRNSRGWGLGVILALAVSVGVLAGPSSTRNIPGDQITRSSGAVITLPSATATLCGINQTCTLTNKTYTLGTASRALITDIDGNIAVADTTSTELQFLAGVDSDLCGITQTCVLSGKTLESATVDDFLNFTEQVSDPSTPASGRLVYAKADGLYQIDTAGAVTKVGSGAGGSFSLITDNNSNFDSSVGDWVAYADAAQATPEDMTGGTPTHITCARDTTAPLMRGDGYLLITNAGSTSAQGEGCSLDFAIDAGDANKTFFWRMMVETSSGYTTDDLKIYAYDVDNAALITPRCTGTDKVWTCSVGLTDSANYRIGFHVASTNTVAWTTKNDEIRLQEESILDTPVKQYLGALTTTGSWTTNTTYIGKYWRDDDMLIGSVRITTSGAPDSVALTLNLPASLGVTIDEDKITGIVRNDKPGVVLRDDSATANVQGVYRYNDATSLALLASTLTAPTNSTIDHDTPITFAADDTIEINYEVPITEWANQSAILSTSEMMNQTALVVLERTNSVTLNDNSETALPFDDASVQYDPTNLYDETDDQIELRESGVYMACWRVNFTNVDSTENIGPGIYLNGSELIAFLHAGTGGNTNKTIGCLPPQQLSKDDAITLFSYYNDTDGSTTGSAVFYELSLWRMPDFTHYGPRSDSVYARYTTTATTSMANGTTSDVVYATLVEDSHGVYDTSTGVITFPRAGLCTITTSIELDNATVDSGYMLPILTDASNTVIEYGTTTYFAAGNIRSRAVFTRKVAMGEQMKMRVFHNNGVARPLSGDAKSNLIVIDCP